MRIIKILAFIGVVALITSCATTADFTVSNAVPAADITAKKKQNKQNNYEIVVIAKNLAEASRLNPPKSNYSVWVVTSEGVTKNLGQLTSKNAQKAVLKTVTPFDVKEIFITAENQGDLNHPSGTEISRAIF